MILRLVSTEKARSVLKNKYTNVKKVHFLLYVYFANMLYITQINKNTSKCNKSKFLLLSSSALSTRISAKFRDAVTRACWESRPVLSSFNMSKYSKNLAATPRIYAVAFFVSSLCITDVNICKHFIWTYRKRDLFYIHTCIKLNKLNIKYSFTLVYSFFKISRH